MFKYLIFLTLLKIIIGEYISCIPTQSNLSLTKTFQGIKVFIVGSKGYPLALGLCFNSHGAEVIITTRNLTIYNDIQIKSTNIKIIEYDIFLDGSFNRLFYEYNKIMNRYHPDILGIGDFFTNEMQWLVWSMKSLRFTS